MRHVPAMARSPRPTRCMGLQAARKRVCEPNAQVACRGGDLAAGQVQAVDTRTGSGGQPVAQVDCKWRPTGGWATPPPRSSRRPGTPGPALAHGDERLPHRRRGSHCCGAEARRGARDRRDPPGPYAVAPVCGNRPVGARGRPLAHRLRGRFRRPCLLGQIECRAPRVLAWLATTPLQWRRQIRYVAIDMSPGCRAVIRILNIVRRQTTATLRGRRGQAGLRPVAEGQAPTHAQPGRPHRPSVQNDL